MKMEEKRVGYRRREEEGKKKKAMMVMAMVEMIGGDGDENEGE